MICVSCFQQPFKRTKIGGGAAVAVNTELSVSFQGVTMYVQEGKYRIQLPASQSMCVL